MTLQETYYFDEETTIEQYNKQTSKGSDPTNACISQTKSKQAFGKVNSR